MTLENYLRENVALALFILYVPIEKVGNSENEVTKITEILQLFYSIVPNKRTSTFNNFRIFFQEVRAYFGGYVY